MFKTVLCALLIGLIPGVAHAQMFQPSLSLGPQISFQAHAATSGAQAPRRGAGPPSPAPAARSRSPETPAEAIVTTYRPDQARRRANLAQFVARTRSVDPAGADNLATIFAQGDIIEGIGKAGAPLGLRITDVADAYATYWINAYNAFQHRNPTPSRRLIAAVQAQAARSLGASAAFRGANDAVRQEMAEAMWIQAALLDVAVEQSKSDPAQMKAVGQAAAQGARSMGLDFTRMKLTEEGFVPL